MNTPKDLSGKPKHSPELEAVARRFFRATSTRDGAAMRNLLSRSTNLRFIGTAPDEIWHGTTLREGIEAHFNEAPAFLIDEEVFGEAYETGDTGWAIFGRRITMDGTQAPIDFRFTLIFTLEDGAWKILHRHASVGIPNTQTHGVEHQALDELAASATLADIPDIHTDIVTILFTDIADSTALAATLGDAPWVAIVQEHLQMIGDQIQGHGGQMVKSLGDGTMSVFPSAGSALKAAQSIQSTLAGSTVEPHIQVRIGAHTGAVVHAGEDFFGTVVNKAARVATKARPGEIRVSEATRAMVGSANDFEFTGEALISLKGLEGEHRLFLLEWKT